MRSAPWVPVSLLLSACAVPGVVREDLERATSTIAAAHRVYAPLCAPRELANAQAHLDFTRIELYQGFVGRAAEHVRIANEQAIAALELATPCGGVDRDQDTIPDIVDLCDDEAEDFDGDNDQDGCRDLDPLGDDDGDGIINLEDGCVDDPEDLDGDRDEDGCPETGDDSDGDGIANLIDRCPSEPEDLDGFEDDDGCADADNDRDGVTDIHDLCPLIPEDRDSWDDEDGCPDPDNDGDSIPDGHDECPDEPGVRERGGCPHADADKDGIADAHDRCPSEPETRNGYLDGDGCPDTPPAGVRVTRTRVEIREMLQFQPSSAEIRISSMSILDDVVQVLVDAPYLHMRIEGHTDSEGSDDLNLQLSNDRARAVREYLEAKGISPGRLSSVGYGETRPIDTNRTLSGRANNRRVEFHLTEEPPAEAAP